MKCTHLGGLPGPEFSEIQRRVIFSNFRIFEYVIEKSKGEDEGANAA